MGTYILKDKEAIDGFCKVLKEEMQKGNKVALSNELLELMAPSVKNNYYKFKMIFSEKTFIAKTAGKVKRKALPINFAKFKYFMIICSDQIEDDD